jgi:hypothetical protein
LIWINWVVFFLASGGFPAGKIQPKRHRRLARFRVGVFAERGRGHAAVSRAEPPAPVGARQVALGGEPAFQDLVLGFQGSM